MPGRRAAFPLRRIVRRADLPAWPGGPAIPMDILECGHAYSPKQDAYGPTNAARRRCHRCAKNAPPDVALPGRPADAEY